MITGRIGSTAPRGWGAEDRADTVYGGAGCDYERAGVEEGVGGSGEQCGDAGYGAYAGGGAESEGGVGAGVAGGLCNFNVTDPVLKDKRVRQAVACAIDRQAIVDAIWRGQARLANTLLPVGHWAAATNEELAQYPHDVARAQRLLEEAGFPAGKDGVRMRLTMKTSTDETTRLMAAVLQQQLRAAGIRAGDSVGGVWDVLCGCDKGAFQMYALRWIGSNEDPDIFRYAYGSGSFPPKGGNRGRYSNARVDALLAEAAASSDRAVRKKDYVEVQQILAEELPGIPLWYPNNEVVHTRRIVECAAAGVRQLRLSARGRSYRRRCAVGQWLGLFGLPRGRWWRRLDR